jgi:hypothetical protein
MNDEATACLSALVNGRGIYDPLWYYWIGGVVMLRYGMWIDQLLADERVTAEERRQLTAVLGLFAHTLWDDDFVPLEGAHGLSVGTENMPVQYSGYRQFFALLLARKPEFTARAGRADAGLRATFASLISTTGAAFGSPHYISASLDPVLNTALAVKQNGRSDPFKTEPRLAKFAEFYLNFLTPPEPRVGGKRCLVGFGDGATGPTELCGILATGFRHADPKLSARLMGAWVQGGSIHSGFFGPSLLKIDESFPDADPALAA